ncbi:hypothetical protein [Nautilia sp.]
MNKKILILTALLFLTATLWSFKFYVSSKKELKNEIEYINDFKTEIYEINRLKNKYSTKPLKILRKICNFEEDSKIYKISCKTDIKNIYKISSFLRSPVKLKTFTLSDENGSLIRFYAEIYR